MSKQWSTCGSLGRCGAQVASFEGGKCAVQSPSPTPKGMCYGPGWAASLPREQEETQAARLQAVQAALEGKEGATQPFACSAASSPPKAPAAVKARAPPPEARQAADAPLKAAAQLFAGEPAEIPTQKRASVSSATSTTASRSSSRPSSRSSSIDTDDSLASIVTLGVPVRRQLQYAVDAHRSGARPRFSAQALEKFWTVLDKRSSGRGVVTQREFAVALKEHEEFHSLFRLLTSYRDGPAGAPSAGGRHEGLRRVKEIICAVEWDENRELDWFGFQKTFRKHGLFVV